MCVNNNHNNAIRRNGQLLRVCVCGVELVVPSQSFNFGCLSSAGESGVRWLVGWLGEGIPINCNNNVGLVLWLSHLALSFLRLLQARSFTVIHTAALSAPP